MAIRIVPAGKYGENELRSRVGKAAAAAASARPKMTATQKRRALKKRNAGTTKPDETLRTDGQLKFCD